MALEVRVKALKFPGARRVRVQFRGVHYYTRNLKGEDLNHEGEIGDVFEWLLASPLGAEERLCLQVQGGWARRPAAHLQLPLGSAVRAPKTPVTLTQHLLDERQRPLRATVTVEILYTAPEMSDSFQGPDDEDLTYHSQLSDDERSHDEMLLEAVKRNILRLEQGMADTEAAHCSKETSFPRSNGSGKRPSTLRTMRNLIRIGKRRPSAESSTDDEGRALLGGPAPAAGATPGAESAADSVAEGSGEGEGREDPADEGPPAPAHASASALPTSPAPEPAVRKTIPNIHTVSQSHLKAQDFQVCLTILEARQLAGLNMDPVVCIQVGDQKKYTSVKESTNCPYYNEYFVFDFHIPPVMLFDKIITLSVLHSRSLLRSGTPIGSFKVDLKTVYEASDHQFYHKWAVLMDPSDAAAGPKGYLKCDISVIGKGDVVKVPPKTEKDEDDIEANLLLPEGVPTERQRARYVVYVHRADGLPKMNLSIMANVKKALTGENKDLVDPYVQVSFAGLSGITSVKRSSYNPVWNEQIVFTDMFPPLCQRIRIQLMDHDPVKPTVIGTHYIDLKAISNDGEKGFLPTFGPAYVYLYGSPRDYTILDQHSALNAGLGEGVSYRARILISIRTEVTDISDAMPSAVEVQAGAVPSEACCNIEENFLLFGTILDATMIDKRICEKPISFELSIGNSGNAIDGLNQSSRPSHEIQAINRGQSTTTPMKALSHDRVHYFLPLWDTKPCLHVTSTWPDHRRRMFTSNMIEKISDNLEEALRITGEKTGEEAVTALRAALAALHVACCRFLELRRATAAPNHGVTTELDKRRTELCHREIENIRSKSRHLKAIVTKSSFKERYRTAQTILAKLKFLIEDPQGALPDVVLWAVGGGRRLAYQRVLARHLLYSPTAEERGKLCGKSHTMFLKLPGKKADGASGWSIPAKLNIHLWLGLVKEKVHFVDGLPGGYEQSREIRNVERLEVPPPCALRYMQQHSFQLRAYIYQARSLIGSDASGLSDPFARVIAGEYCRTTRVIDETLSPTWDQTLVCEDITLFGSLDQIKEDPFTITIEVFDQDQVGKSEFIGRAIAKPHVKAENDTYTKPSLEWYEITRGLDHAGELLAAFELLQTSRGSAGEMMPPVGVPPLPLSEDGNYMPVPDEIRPTLANYRIEVLFWGLRNLKRVHFMSVDKPRVDIECAGNILSSSVIQNAQKNPNFCSSVKIMDVELPEEELYRPPLTIRVVDCRSFGRFTLVGTHMINSIHKYIVHQTTGDGKQTEAPKRLNYKSKEQEPDRFGYTIVETKLQVEGDQENSPLLFRELQFSHSYGSGAFNKKKVKIDEKKKRGQFPDIDDDDDESSKDWWTKYFASVDEMIEEGRIEKYSKNRKNDSLSGYSDVESNDGKEQGDRKRKFKAISTSVKIASRLSPTNDKKRCLPSAALCKVFPNELEAQAMFDEFKDWLQTFELYRGKKTSEDAENDSRIVGAFKALKMKYQIDKSEHVRHLIIFAYNEENKATKAAIFSQCTMMVLPMKEQLVNGSKAGAIKVYQWPLLKSVESIGFDPQFGFFQGMPSNDPLRVLVRVYIIKANDLHPMDLNGKADPYIVLQLGSKKICDKDNYISKQLNPVFGKCFEVEATFPRDSILSVKIQDWDLVGSDDVIGETKIDLENRFYSKHRATCGLSRQYEEQGYNRWRDSMKPTQILAKLCKDGKLEPPCYEPGRVRIGRQIFDLDVENLPGTSSDDGARNKLMEERSALQVLHRWQEVPRVGCHLVPEHIETRPLYNPDKPGIERGKLEMWVDMFPMDLPPPGPPIDISPRKPKSYELRIIIWNTDDVVLEDDAFFTGEKMSDIYVKGWLKGPEDCQSTDIHYRSLTGEGNFNWRFSYPFDYLVAEEKIVISKKESLFSWDETQSKIPARLELQVWDADHFSADDFLGAITLDLNRFPRGAKSSKLCTLDMLKTDGSVPMVNIFKQRRIKGWWPFYIKKENDEIELTGKVEAEIHLLTKEEAEKNPAGVGRNEPDALDRPNRPDASFMWFLNPLKSARYIIWHNYKWRVLKALVFIALAMLILLFFYAIPGYTVKRFLGA